MSTLEKKKAMRLKFMNALYEETDGDEEHMADPDKLATEMGLKVAEPFVFEEDADLREYVKAVQFLEGEGLIRRLIDEIISPVYITHKGVVEVERAQENPDQPTKYFPPAATVIYVGRDMIASPIQQAGAGSTQYVTIIDEGDRQNLKTLVGRLRSEIGQIPLDEDEKQEVEAEIRTIEAQLSSPQPKSPIIKTALQSAQRVLEGAAGNVAGSGLTNLFGEALSYLS